jgi:hypothetical protein
MTGWTHPGPKGAHGGAANGSLHGQGFESYNCAARRLSPLALVAALLALSLDGWRDLLTGSHPTYHLVMPGVRVLLQWHRFFS